MDEATEKRILDILKVFKICDATQILEYRYKHRLIREVIHKRIPEDFWQKLCEQQFPKIYIEGKKRSGLLWRELYNAFTLWKNVEKAKVELIEITMPDTKSYNFLEDRKITCSHRLLDECPEEYADMIVHYDLTELGECYRKTFDSFNSFYENDAILIRQSGQSLYVTRKAFSDSEDAADDIRPETAWTVLDNDIYYQKDDADTQSMWRCTVDVINDRPNYDKGRLIEVSGQMLDVTKKDDQLYALYSEFNHDVALVGINGNEMELCEQLNGDNWYKLTEQYGLDWAAPRTFPIIRDRLDSTVFNNYDFEVVVSHQNLIVAATKTRPIKLIAYYVKYDEPVLTFEPISPSWSVVIDDHLDETSQLRNREDATISSLGIVEITCGHRILAIYCNKVIIIELTHVDLLRYYKDDDTSSSEQEHPVGMPKPVSPMPDSSPDEGTEDQGNNVANQDEAMAGPSTSRPPLEADTPMRIILPVMSRSELVVSSTTGSGSGFRPPAAFPRPGPDRQLWPRLNQHPNGYLGSRANRDRPDNRMLGDDSGDDNDDEDGMEEPVVIANNSDSDSSNDERRERPVLIPPNFFQEQPNGVAANEDRLMDRAAHNIQLIDGSRNATMNGERINNNPFSLRYGGNGAALIDETENENNENAEREGGPDNAWQGSRGMVQIHTANISIGGNGAATNRGRRRTRSGRSNIRNLITQATPYVTSPPHSSNDSDSNSSGSLRIPNNEEDYNPGRGYRHVDNSGGGAAGPSGSGGGAARPSGSGGGAAGPSGSGGGAAGPSGSSGGAAGPSSSGGRHHPRLQAEMQNIVEAMPALPSNDPNNEQEAAEEERPPRNETLRQSPLLSLRLEYSSASDSNNSVISKKTSDSDNQLDPNDARREEDDNTRDSTNSDRNSGSGTSNGTDDENPPPLEDSRIADYESSGMSGSGQRSSGRSDTTDERSGLVTEEENSPTTEDSPSSLEETNDDNIQQHSPATQPESADDASGPSHLQPGSAAQSADGSGSAKSDRTEDDNSPESEDSPSPVEEPSDVALQTPSSARKHDHDDDDNDRTDGPKATKIPRLEDSLGDDDIAL